jgi:hypothetical protein
LTDKIEGRVLNIPSAKDGWELRLDPVPRLVNGDRLFVDWEAMTYSVGRAVPPVSSDRIAEWRRLGDDGKLAPRELRMLEEIERLRGLASEGEGRRPQLLDEG